MANLTTILERLTLLEREVETLKGRGSADDPSRMSASERVAYFESLPLSAVVGKDYVAWKFGVSIHAILNGNPRTNKIPRYSKRPLKFIKADVDRVFEQTAKTPIRERAKEEIKKAKPRRYSVVGK